MEQGKQFLGMPKVILDHPDRFTDDGTGNRTLEMHDPGKPEGSSAYIHYEVPDADDDHPEYRGIEYLKSNDEGKGHMTTLLDHFYQRNPDSHFDWGHITHPASEHLFFKFREKYGHLKSHADSFPDDHEDD